MSKIPTANSAHINKNRIKITIPIIQHVVNLLIKVTLIEKIEDIELLRALDIDLKKKTL